MRSGAMTVRPSGFLQPDAILARNLFGATPADAVRPVSSRMRSFSRRATSTPSGSPQAFSVTSRYASSSDSGSTSGVTSRKMAKTWERHGGVLAEVGRDDDELGTEPDGPRHRDRGAHAEGPRFVARGGDDAAALGPAADGDRAARCSAGSSRCSTDA